jgi:hypothetical protein
VILVLDFENDVVGDFWMMVTGIDDHEEVVMVTADF